VSKFTDRRCDNVLPSQGYFARHKQKIYIEVLQPIMGVTMIFSSGRGASFLWGQPENLYTQLHLDCLRFPFKDIRVIFKTVLLIFYADIWHIFFFLQFPLCFKKSREGRCPTCPHPRRPYYGVFNILRDDINIYLLHNRDLSFKFLCKYYIFIGIHTS
jgi:hypothetical protein